MRRMILDQSLALTVLGIWISMVAMAVMVFYAHRLWRRRHPKVVKRSYTDRLFKRLQASRQDATRANGRSSGRGKPRP